MPPPNETKRPNSLLLKEAIAKNIATHQLRNSRTPLYYPSIFKYKCRGAFSARIDEPGSKGLCRGIQSQLSHVRDLRQCTENDSVDMFLQATNNNYQRNDTGVDEIVEDVLRKRAIIYNNLKNEKVLNVEKNDSTLVNDENVPKIDAVVQSKFEAQENWHKWNAYGSTDVHLLVLRDSKTNDEKIVGLAPDCRFGLSLRDIGKEGVGGVNIAVGRLGPLELTTIRHDETRKSAEKQMSTDRNVGKIITLQDFYDQSGKLVHAMKVNAIILRDAFSEDFPARCWQSSQRIVSQFGKTLNQSSKLLQDLYKIWKDNNE
mmetsp:Transcript_21501/g.31814  ORF Transcript_21501/g.31814 Transcript_21501/m.31814 type:complete len:316 (-) Transcript_21501:31-978(-)